MNSQDLTLVLISALILAVLLIPAVFLEEQRPGKTAAEPVEDETAAEEEEQAQLPEPQEPEHIEELTGQKTETAGQPAEEPPAEFVAKTDTEEVEPISKPDISVQTKTAEPDLQEITGEVPKETAALSLEEQKPQQQEPVEEAPKESFFSRLRNGLSKTRTGFIDKLDAIISRTVIDDEVWEGFEETLVMADLGVTTTMKLREDVEREIESNSITDPHEIKNILKSKILEILKESEGAAVYPDTKPFIMMVAGVNGVGKTTTIGKLSNKFKDEDKKVMVAAADTFRAAAVDQLEVWANRVGADFIRGQSGADPSAVAFDAVKASVSRSADILIIDTAGRLHTRENLMDELKKMRKVVSRELEGAPHETLLVLDATTGQNAIQQAKMFNEAIDLTGIALTKLDGTAKGGVIISIANELSIPVKYIGIGERLEDLREFNAEEFVEALFGDEVHTIH